MAPRETRLITTSFGLSLLLHALVLIPVFTVALTAASSGETRSKIEPDAIALRPAPEPKPPEEREEREERKEPPKPEPEPKPDEPKDRKSVV